MNTVVGYTGPGEIERLTEDADDLGVILKQIAGERGTAEQRIKMLEEALSSIEKMAPLFSHARITARAALNSKTEGA